MQKVSDYSGELVSSEIVYQHFRFHLDSYLLGNKGIMRAQFFAAQLDMLGN